MVAILFDLTWNIKSIKHGLTIKKEMCVSVHFSDFHNC